MTDHIPRRAWIVLRILVGLPFIGSGIFNTIHWDASNQFNAILLGDTLAPGLTVLGILQIAGGLSIVTGYQMRFGAMLLLAFLIPATLRHFLAARALIGDDSLTVIAKRGQLSCVEKNVGLIGIMIFMLIVDLRGRHAPDRTSGTAPARRGKHDAERGFRRPGQARRYRIAGLLQMTAVR